MPGLCSEDQIHTPGPDVPEDTEIGGVASEDGGAALKRRVACEDWGVTREKGGVALKRGVACEDGGVTCEGVACEDGEWHVKEWHVKMGE